MKGKIQMSRGIPVIIDTDPGIDDAVALAIALNHPKIDVRLITTVSGNVDVLQTTENALKLVSFMNQETPVAKGCGKPLIIEPEDSSEIHGETGMDGYDFPKNVRKALPNHAVEVMKETLENSEEPMVILAIAALTNLALLFSLYPDLKKKVAKIVMMGGTLSRGNTNTSAEFNTYVDPHAAQMVFQSGIPIVMVGLDVTSTAVLTAKEVGEIKKLGNVGQMFYDLFQHYRGGSLKTGLKMHDVCAVAYLVQPELFQTQVTFVEVALEGPAAGATVADLKMKYHTETNCEVCLEIDVPKFQKWLVKSLDVTGEK
jgi:non-specific riboncleoside hydrolase